MHHMTAGEWVAITVLVYVICFAVVAKLLRLLNNPAGPSRRRATPIVIGWVLLALAPATVVGGIVWSVVELVLHIHGGISNFARLGKPGEPKQ